MRTMLALLCALLSSASQAETSVLFFGLSRHGSCDSSRWHCDLNGRNPGLGVEWSAPQTDYQLFVRGGSYRDSLRQTAYFAAAGARKMWVVQDEWQVGAGAMAGYLNGSGVHGLAGLPFISLGTERVQLEVGYLPRLHWKNRMMPATTTFNLRWQLD